MDLHNNGNNEGGWITDNDYDREDAAEIIRRGSQLLQVGRWTHDYYRIVRSLIFRN